MAAAGGMSAAAAAFVALAVGHATHEAKLKALKVVELRAICMGAAEAGRLLRPWYRRPRLGLWQQ